MNTRVLGKRRAALYGCASVATVMLFVAPSHAEQQLFNFSVNGALSNDNTNPAFGGPQTSFSTGCCRSYYGPGQGPHDAPVLPGGFMTTSSGPGAISEATAKFTGVNGSAVTGTRATDSYDGYGVIGFRQGGTIVTNFGGLTVTRQVNATHGDDGGATTITAKFASGGIFNAARWVETISNTTGAPISGSMAYFTNLGSDSNTNWVASSSGNTTSATGNRWLTSIQSGTPTDPVITHVFGNNALTTTSGQMLHANGDDNPEWQYPVTVKPGQTKRLILFNIMTADINYGAGTVASDIALGGQLANLITNNGAPISPESPAFVFFSDFSREELFTVINYDFVGLTIDTSRPFFTETDYAVTHANPIFDGGVLKPTKSVIFNSNFQVNAAGGTIDNSNGVLTFNGVFSGIGPLTFAGTTSTILTATNTYTGATSIDGGMLVVNGSIASSSLTTVNAGGVLAGTGTVGNTAVANGGTFAPGSATTGSSMTVAGNLAFQAGASYLVRVNPATASFATVTGNANLAGATVNAAFDPGTYVAKRYNILSAGSVTGAFGPVVNTNLPSGFATSTSTDATHAYLDLSLTFGPFTGLSLNQQAIANSLAKFFNTNGSIPTVFGFMTPAGLSQLSGEGATGSQQTTFNAMSQFLGLLSDPFVSGRGDPVAGGGQPNAYADPSLSYAASEKRRPTKEAFAAMEAKLRVAPPTFEQRWSVWAAGYGGSQTTNGNTTVGSNTTTSSVYGAAVGADYRISPFTLAGFAIGGGGTNFSVAGSGSGHSDLVHAGAFVRQNIGAAYLSAALAYGRQDITTDRMIAGSQLRAEFSANAISGRLEGGYRTFVPFGGGFGLTPYAAGQFTNFQLPNYAERILTGVGAASFPLAYGSKSVTDVRSELGVRADKSFAVENGIFTLRSRLAWAHDFDPDRSITPTFQALPGASFVVNGAAPAPNSLLVTAAVERKWLNGFSVAGTFEGEFSNVTSSYAGKGVLRYAW